MSQIDISQWKEFKVIKLFKLFHGKRLVKKNRIPGEIPFLTAGFDNQGVKDYLSGNFQIWHKPITIDMFGNCFYHDFDCTGDDNVYALVNNKVSNLSKLFIASVLNTQLNIQFSYKDQFRQNDLDKLVIKLPVDSNGDPDWQYMDTYIAKLTTLAHKNVNALKEAKAKPAKLNIDQWGEFKLSELFEPEFTDGDNKVGQLEEDDTGVNLIGPLSSNNGILGKFISNTKIFPKNTLTWDMFGTCYWQKEPYQTVSHGHVLVLNPKVHINSASLLYLATILTKLGHQKQFGYTNMLTINKYNKLYIKLPIDAKGEPDWEYMSNQVRHFATLSDLTITSLRSVI